ncbi:MAG TPA: FAD-dependent oxidoreductase [Nitrososphaerales archaeon]|nr:FAD-dependent oxidoreductase [Nitrososphaerales archaeon]
MSLGATRPSIVVVGGGMAGLVAAARAAELGSDVVLIDKGGFLGEGNTLTTSGAYYTAGLPPTSTPDELYSRVMSSGVAFPETAQAWAENAGRALQWLESVGIQVDRTGEGPPRLESISSVSMAPVYKVDVGPNIVKKLRAYFHSRNGISVSKTKVVKLVVKHGDLAGVETVDSTGKKAVVPSKAVVLATGGFQANKELVKKHLGRHANDCKMMGSSAATGDGLKMAVDVGAKTVNLNYFYGRLVSQKALMDDRFWPYPTMGTLIEDGIVVDKSGRRFRDEGWGDVPLANLVARWEDVANVFLVFDETAWERSKRDPESLVAPNPWLVEKDGLVYKAESLSELAGKLGVNGKNLETTVQGFNMAAGIRRLGELAIPRINHPSPLKSPFYGVKLVPGIISTMGGPLVDKRMNVVGRKGNRIPGLFAAGDVVGGLTGGLNGGYVGGISQAAVTGLIAGESAHKFVTTRPLA